jgi:hypothetical protein
MSEQSWIGELIEQYSYVSRSYEVREDYLRLRLTGMSHRLAEVLATRSFPAVHGTNSSFMKGSHIQDGVLDSYRHKMANAMGVDTSGKRYIAGLASYPGDPEAWVSGTDDVLRVCRNRGWNCTGAVEYEAPDSRPVCAADIAPDLPIAPDIVADHVSSRLASYDPREVTPGLKEEIVDYETRRLSGKLELDQSLKVSEYTHEDSVRISGD